MSRSVQRRPQGEASTWKVRRRARLLAAAPQAVRPALAVQPSTPVVTGGETLLGAFTAVFGDDVTVEQLFDREAVQKMVETLQGDSGNLRAAQLLFRRILAYFAERTRLSESRLAELGATVSPSPAPTTPSFLPDVMDWYNDEWTDGQNKNRYRQANWVLRHVLSTMPDLQSDTGHVRWDMVDDMRVAQVIRIANSNSGTERSAQSRLSCFRGLCLYAAENGKLNHEVLEEFVGFSKFEYAKAQRAIADADLLAMMYEVAANGRPIDKAILALVAELGPRISSAIGLDDDDVVLDMPHPYVVFRRGTKREVIPPQYLSPELASVLRWYRSHRANTLESPRPFFRTREGTREDYQSARRRFHEIADAAGVKLPKGTAFHGLRHRLISGLVLIDGLHWAAVASAMGFTDVRSLLRYVREHPTVVYEASEKLFTYAFPEAVKTRVAAFRSK